MSPKKKMAKEIDVDRVVKGTREVIRHSPFKENPQPGTTPKIKYSTTAINLPSETLALLKQVAGIRAAREGGRISVSAVLAKLVEDNREKLEKELDIQ